MHKRNIAISSGGGTDFSKYRNMMRQVSHGLFDVILLVGFLLGK